MNENPIENQWMELTSYIKIYLKTFNTMQQQI